MDKQEMILYIILAALISFASVSIIDSNEIDGVTGLEITDVEYNPTTGIVTVSGTSNYSQLMLFVEGPVQSSEYRGCIVRDGSFSGKVYLEDQSLGIHTAVVFANNAKATEDFHIYGIDLVEESITVNANSAINLELVSHLPDNSQEIVWSSNEPGIVEVVDNRFTINGLGECVLKAESGIYFDSCHVTVEPIILSLSENKMNMEVGDSRTLVVKNLPSGYKPENVYWKSESTSVATVDSGMVKAVSEGSTNITASLAGGLYTGSCAINVFEPPASLNEYSFFIQMTMDFDIADLRSYTEEEVKEGFTITAEANDAAEALMKACKNNGIPLYINDDPSHEFYGWIGSMFGLGDVPIGADVWKYWVQYKDGNYNQWALGYYKDGGNFQLIYKATTMDEADPFPPGVEIEKLYVKEQPTKTTYEVGESFDPMGMVVMADMSVGDDLQIYEYDIDPEVFTVLGEQKVTLTYRGHSTTVDVDVIEVPELVSIEVTELPDKTHYYVGEKLDPKGMVVTATMSDGTKAAVDAKVPETVFTSAGEQTITVSYLDKTAAFKVTVEDYYIPEPDEDDVDKVVNPDGSTTTTTTVDKTDSNGNTVKSEEKVTVQEDGSSKGTKTETITDKDGNVTERNTVTETDKDGNVKSESNTTVTRNDGTTVDTKETVEKDKDGSVKTTESTVTSGDKVTESKTTVKADANGNTTGTETESKTTETLKDADGNKTGTMETEIKETVGKDGKSEREESVVAESDDGNVKTETTSKTDKDGNVTAESKTTVKSESKDVGADVIDAALKQSEQTLSNVTADNKKVDKTVEVEVASGTSAALSPEAVKKVSDYGAGLKVSVKEGSIDTDSDVLKNLAKDGKTVELSMEANNKAALKGPMEGVVGDNHFIDLNALVGGKNVHQLGGKAIITFGYQLKDGESAVDLKVFYVDDDGNKTLVDATFGDGAFTMTVDHFSVYMVENTAAPAPVDPETPEDDKDEGGLSPVLIAGIVVVIIAAIVGVVLYTKKN